MKVGIRFWDMDYINDILDFFHLFIIPEFVEREPGHMVTHLTSSMIVELFNSRLPYLIRLRQYHMDRGSITAPLSDYCHITESDVYWDQQTPEGMEVWAESHDVFIWTSGKELNT